mgnify:CR=1 FL=1
MITVPKGWGKELWIVNKEDYCGKILYFNKGFFCSFHYHLLKAESFYLRSGQILLKFSKEDDITKAKELILNPGDVFDVPRGLRHQMFALKDSELFEFSTHHENADSYRIKIDPS